VSLYRDLLDEDAGSEQRLVGVARAGARATVTFDEPARLNALSARLVLQTKRALSELTAAPDVLVVVLTGAGRETALTMEEFAEPNCFTTAPFHASVRARLERHSS
jgi:hypothetical protein